MKTLAGNCSAFARLLQEARFSARFFRGLIVRDFLQLRCGSGKNLINSRMMIRTLLLAMILASTTGCTSQTWEVTRPLQKKDIGKVSVIRFTGHNAGVFEDFVITELVNLGVPVVERSRIISVLTERELSLNDLTEGRVKPEIIKKLAGVDTLVFGSITPIVVYVSGAMSGKVSSASLRFVDTQTGNIISSASFSANSDLLALAPTYYGVASKLIRRIVK